MLSVKSLMMVESGADACASDAEQTSVVAFQDTSSEVGLDAAPVSPLSSPDVSSPAVTACDMSDDKGLDPEQCSARSNSSANPRSEAGLSDTIDEEQGKDLLADVKPRTLVSDTERPCAHNQWTKQTKKRGKLVLRCRVCACVWKTRPETHEKCAAFHAGYCELGDPCPHPHVYARRESSRKKKEPSDSDDLAESSNVDAPAAAADEEAVEECGQAQVAKQGCAACVSDGDAPGEAVAKAEGGGKRKRRNKKKSKRKEAILSWADDLDGLDDGDVREEGGCGGGRAAAPAPAPAQAPLWGSGYSTGSPGCSEAGLPAVVRTPSDEVARFRYDPYCFDSIICPSMAQ